MDIYSIDYIYLQVFMRCGEHQLKYRSLTTPNFSSQRKLKLCRTLVPDVRVWSQKDLRDFFGQDLVPISSSHNQQSDDVVTDLHIERRIYFSKNDEHM